MIAAVFLLAFAQVSELRHVELTPSQFFEAGVNARQNAREARTAFAKAAQGFDGDWNAALPQSSQLALARARSHFLAGNLPRALVAIHDGLGLTPYDVELQRDLLALRGTIRYPDTVDAATRVRPDEPRGLRFRVSPWDAYFAAMAFGILAAVGSVKLFTSRPRWAGAAVGIGLAGMAASGWVAWRISHEESRPLVIVTADTILRRGNGPSFPPRISDPLPRGAELSEVGRRGVWVQVELPGGATGWLPEAHVLR